MREMAAAMARCTSRGGFTRPVLVLLAVMALRIYPADAVTNPNDTLALQALKMTLEDPDDSLRNWNGNNPCESGWNGVICAAPPGSNNITYVIELRLFQLNLGGSLAPELGGLSQLEILNMMWNNLTGSIPKSFEQLSNLRFLLLSGNQLSGILPPELGQLTQLTSIQIDQNRITGQIPSTFGGLSSIEHLHMSDNLLNGTIPKELGALPSLLHILLDNNALIGELPSEIANASMLQIIQLDNNRFDANTAFPETWGNITTLNKLSLRNCSINGTIPDLGGLKTLNVLDLSHNNLTGPIPATLPTNLTSLDLSNNQLTQGIPDSVGTLQRLEVLMLRNNQLSGFVPVSLGTAPTFQSAEFSAVIDLQNNTLETSDQKLAILVTNTSTKVRFAGNPDVCPDNMTSPTLNPLCVPVSNDVVLYDTVTSLTEYPSSTCLSCENITVGCLLVSPGFSLFDRYDAAFISWISAGLNLTQRQVVLRDYTWREGPQLFMTILLYPDKNYTSFVTSEFEMLYNMFAEWLLPESELFGPFQLVSFEPRSAQEVGATSKGVSALVLSAIVLGVAVSAVLVTSLFLILVCRRHRTPTALRAQMSQLVRMTKARKNPALKVAGVEFFTFKELSKATDQFSVSHKIGEGGYGKVYQAILRERKKVAIKRAQRASLQAANEFYTEIEFMSRCHHRNLVKLVGYCDDEGEQMLVYEYMSGGTLRHQMESRKGGGPLLDFPTRLRIAVGSARGLLYLHTDADPPIIHRDVKAVNILLNDLMVAKVADFGLSKQAPVPDTNGNIAAYISTGVKGTPGYIDPEYHLTHQLTEKSDVYSFGVVLLELITNRRAISQGKTAQQGRNLVQEAQLRERSGQVLTLVDPDIVHYPWGILELFMRLALRCCARLPQDRPNMAEVVRELENIANSSSDSSTPDTYILDMSQSHEGYSHYWNDTSSEQSLVHSVSVNEADTVELLSKTISFVKVR